MLEINDVVFYYCDLYCIVFAHTHTHSARTHMYMLMHIIYKYAYTHIYLTYVHTFIALLRLFQTQETSMHYCARAGNADVLLEMVKHIEPNIVQNVVNQQAKARRHNMLYCFIQRGYVGNR